MENALEAPPFILWFDRIGLADLPLVGGKNASLGELVRELASKGVRVPNGFAVTAHAYRSFVREAGLEGVIEKRLQGLDLADTDDLARRGRTIREAMLAADLPSGLAEALGDAYKPQ